MKREILVVLCLCLVSILGCGPDRSSPRETIATITRALNDRDSAVFINSMDQTVRDRIAHNQAGLAAILDSVRGSQVTSEVVSVDTSGVLAHVVFNVHLRGRTHRDVDHVDAQFVKEDDGWKMGPISSIAGQPFGARY